MIILYITFILNTSKLFFYSISSISKKKDYKVYAQLHNNLVKFTLEVGFE